MPFGFKALILMFPCHVTPKSISRRCCFMTKLARISHRRVFEMHSLYMAKCFVSTRSPKLTNVAGKKPSFEILHNMGGDGFFAGSNWVCKIEVKDFYKLSFQKRVDHLT